MHCLTSECAPICFPQPVLENSCLPVAGSSSGASRNAAADDDDNGEDDIEIAAELDLDAVLERRRAAAVANGDMVDLAADVDEAAIAAAAAAMAADAEAAKREAAERAKEARLERFRVRKVCLVAAYTPAFCCFCNTRDVVNC